MDAATIRATCPKCQAALRIPAAWAGQVVKCKKCGSGVRTVAPAAPAAVSSEDTPPNGHVPPVPHPPNAFADIGPSYAPKPARDNPFEGDEPPAPMPGYPYAPPQGYGAPPPGYGYAPPPGYAYPPPHGYEAAGYPQYQPAAYPQPLPPPPAGPSAAATAMSGFTPSEATASRSRRGGYRRRSDRGKYIWIGIALILTGGLVAGGIYGAKYLKNQQMAPGEGANNGGGGDPKNGGGDPKNPKGLLANSGNFPRRLLFIHISNYLYLNPLTHSQVDGKIQGPDLTKPAAHRLAAEWRIPSDQVFVLSDTASGNDRRPPMRDVLAGTYDRFFETSRAQDRIIVYFGGHVLTKDGKTYLVPIEGDPDEPEKLVPLDDFYAKMKACKATQKVVIWDVARYNTDRGRNRPGSEPLAPETATALGTPPAGVQAILTCQAGENALEFYNIFPEGPLKPPVVGSNFLAAAKYVSDKNRNNAKQQNPDDALAVEAWATAVGQRAAEVVASEGKGKQTVKLVGTAPKSLVAFNKEEAPASKFEFPASPQSASPKEVSEISAELGLPSIKKDDGSSGIGDFPFPAESLAPYKGDVSVAEIRADKTKYAFRNAVLDAFDTIRQVWNGDGDMQLRDELREKSSDNLKKRVLDEQKFPALGISRIERAIFLLDAVAPMKESEPKRWQAHFDYALAQCKSRYAWLQEYNLALGNIRTELLPPLDEKKGQDGYRLVAAEKLKIKKEAKSAEEAKEIYAKMIEDYKGSPWAILAKRDKAVSLGLAWQPYSFGSGMPEAETPVMEPKAPMEVTFAKAQAVLQTHCVSCHGTPQIRANIDFRTLESIKRKPGLLMPGNPSGSDMWNAIMSDTMPPPDAKTKLTAAEKQIIKDWIAGGAK
ncbi:MAG: c-type cytochrome domain-containing protein [Gemmataceae bacterium]